MHLYAPALETECTVSWTEPVAYDARDPDVSTRRDPEWLKPGETLKASKWPYSVRYSATDASGNFNSCSFLITVSEVQCEPLRPPFRGGVSCTDDYNFLSECTYSCDDGFDIPRPLIIEYLDMNEQDVSVVWDEPTVVDNADFSITAKLSMGQPPGSSFTVGAHTILYTAIDTAGNEANPCEFTVSVRAITCPVVHKKPYQLVSCPGGNSYGSRCEFSCEDGAQLIGTNFSYCIKEGDPPVGYWDWEQLEGSQPKCEGHPCRPLRVPQNGALACDKWLFGKFCTMLCNDQYDIPPNVDDLVKDSLWVCGKSGNWDYPDPPHCSENKRPNNIRLPSELQYFIGDCVTGDTQEQIKENFVQIFQESAFGFICADLNCAVDNVNVICGETTGRKSADTAANSSEPFVLTIKFDLALPISDDISVYEGEQLGVLWGLFTTAQPINAKRVQSAATKTKALSIAVRDALTDKAPGEYQPTRGQLSCISCQPATTTLLEGAVNASACENFDFQFPSQNQNHSSYVRYGDMEFKNSSGITVSFWLWFDKNCDRNASIFYYHCVDTASDGVGNASALYPCLYMKSPHSPLFGLRRDNDTAEIQTGTTLRHETWHHVGVVYRTTNSTYTITVDGSVVTEGSFTQRQQHLQETINQREQDGMEPFAGFISNVNIWSHAKNQSDLLDMAKTCVNKDAGDVLSWSQLSRAEQRKVSLQIPSLCDDTDECASAPCGDNTCVDQLRDYSCMCKTGFTGQNCEINIDDCEDNVCQNNATCLDGVGNYTCLCPKGFVGDFCGVESVCKNLTDPVNGFATCNSTDDEIHCTISCKPGFEFYDQPVLHYYCGQSTSYLWNHESPRNPLARYPPCS
ncbi:hypothetical protein Bbelb_159290, partial [Branchiostoma belcheri]